MIDQYKKDNFREIAIGDERYFALSLGERAVQRELDKSDGTIPVYSGNVTVPFGYVKETVTITEFDRDYVIWGIDDANFDFGMIDKGSKFDITDHCGAIKILDDNIIPQFLFYQLQSSRKSLRFNWLRRPNLAQMGKVTVRIPITFDGSFDVRAQELVADKFIKIRQMKLELRELEEDLRKGKFMLTDAEIGHYESVSLADEGLFIVSNGCRIRLEDIEKVRGDIPVYSSSKFKNEVLGNVSDEISQVINGASSFDGLNLTVAAEGYGAGTVFLRRGKFYANDVCNVIKIINDSIDPMYVLYELRTQIHSMVVGWTNKLYKGKLKKISVRIPINGKGQFDLQKQTLLAYKYEQAENLRDEITTQLTPLIDARIII